MILDCITTIHAVRNITTRIVPEADSKKNRPPSYGNTKNNKDTIGGLICIVGLYYFSL